MIDRVDKMAVENDLAIERIAFGPEPKPTKSFELADAGRAVNLAILASFARTLPEAYWRRAAVSLEWLKRVAAPGRQRAIAQRVAEALDLKSPPRQAASIALATAASRSEHLMQVLKTRFSDGWRPELEVDGMRHVEEALASGRGVVLWVAPLAYSTLAAKMAFHDAGHEVWHFSDPGDSFSRTAFGNRHLNPLRADVEENYLAGRVVFDPADPNRALDELRRRAEGGAIVSITARAWESGNVFEVPFMGRRLRLAADAPALAKRTAAACLPVFAVRKQKGGPISVEIDEPLDLVGDPSNAVSRAAAQFTARLETRVTLYPGQWLGWRDLT